MYQGVLEVVVIVLGNLRGWRLGREGSVHGSDMMRTEGNAFVPAITINLVIPIFNLTRLHQ
jgi:hypothetical protein